MIRAIVLAYFFLLTPVAAGETVGFIYGSQSGTLRRVLIPDNDVDLATPKILDDGESLLVVNRTTVQSAIDAMRAGQFDAGEVFYRLLEQTTGKDAHPQPAAIVDQAGNVVAVIPADPSIDSIAGKILIPAFDGVSTGDFYDAKTKTFIAPTKQVVIPSGTKV